MSELRILRKNDGTEVLQQSVKVPNLGQNGVVTMEAHYEWRDVPVVCERVMPLRTGKIQSIGGCARDECGKNGREFELVVTHKVGETHLCSWNDHDLIVNDAFPDYKMIIKHANITSFFNGFAWVKYLVQFCDANNPNAYIQKDMFLNYPCLNLYDQEYINSKRKPKNEVVRFSFGDSFNVGNLVIKHFRNKSGEKQFDRWKPGQIIANRKNRSSSKMVVKTSLLASVTGMYNTVGYSITCIGNGIQEEYVKEGEEFELVEDVINKSETSIPVPSPCEQPSCDTNVKEEANEVMEFGQFILDKIEGMHCRNVKGWHNVRHWRRQGTVALLFNYLPMLNRITNVQN